MVEATALVIEIPLRGEYRAGGHGVVRRRGVIVRASDGTHSGWGEFVELPGYSPETVETALANLNGTPLTHSNPMAVAALRTAKLDLEAKQRDMPLATLLGGEPGPVVAGAVVGRLGDLPGTLAEAKQRISEGYRKIKLKIGPGFDIAPLTALRADHPELALAADANGGYEPDGVPSQLADLGLLYLEQPFPALTRWEESAELRARQGIPISLDESITGPPTLRSAVAAGACDIVNLKAARVAGLRAAKDLHDLACESGISLVAGGLLETGIGRAAALALARLPGFTFPADLSASDRYWDQDLVNPPFSLQNGNLTVSPKPGLGVEVDEDRLAAVTLSQHSLPTRTPG